MDFGLQPKEQELLAGRGAPPQTTGIAGDFGSPNTPTNIVRYGPNTTITATPSSRVATGMVPPTGGGMKRYLATVDGAPIHMPDIGRASKWDHASHAERGDHQGWSNAVMEIL